MVNDYGCIKHGDEDMLEENKNGNSLQEVVIMGFCGVFLLKFLNSLKCYMFLLKIKSSIPSTNTLNWTVSDLDTWTDYAV